MGTQADATSWPSVELNTTGRTRDASCRDTTARHAMVKCIDSLSDLYKTRRTIANEPYRPKKRAYEPAIDLT